MATRQAILTAACALAAGLITACNGEEKPTTTAAPTEAVMFKKVTPILFTDDVQRSVDFFNALGFAKTIEVPYDRGLQFAAVAADGVEIMFQARDTDDPTFTPEEMNARVGQGFVYIEISDFDRIVKAVEGAPMIKDAHETPYGAKEIYIREPGGNVVGFAKQAQ